MAAALGWGAVGAYVRSERLRQRLTQDQVAERLTRLLGYKVKQNKVSKNERGKEWKPELVRAYAAVLELDVESTVELFLGDPHKRRAKILPPMRDYLRLREELDDQGREALLCVYNALVSPGRK